MAESRRTTGRDQIAVLAGGVGAARFLRGLCSLLEPERLTVIVNTADDETFFGLHVSPDLDTVTYTLANRVGRLHGWGVEGDTYACLAALRRFYGERWFQLGDADLATHIFRTDRLRQGDSLSRVSTAIARRHGVGVRILPMSDDPVRTIIDVAGVGPLAFQEYLVKRRGRGSVRGVRFAGIETARPAPGVLAALRRANAVILPPSNPIVSIDPILALTGVRDALRRQRHRVAAISPLVGGRPIKGPLHRMLRGLGHEVSAVGVANLYRDFATLFVLDRQDARLAARVRELGMRVLVTNTIMRNRGDSRRLAAQVLETLES
jgi:LPPG:FO 2-phospho-L-lactate transferase